MSIIRVLTIQDIKNYAEHLIIHSKESGVDGSAIHYPLNRPLYFEKIIEKCTVAWKVPIGDLGWSRAWGLISDDKIMGHLRLKGGNDLHEMHRVDLSIGLKQSFRGNGYGSKLMEEALSWTKNQKSICWVDLGTSELNTSAWNLYKNFGFQEVGRTQDRFRINGVPINDVHFVLNLKELKQSKK